LLIVGSAMPIGSLLGGWAADRFSRKTALVTATLLAGAALLVVGEATSRSEILVGVFGAALFAQAYLPAGSALLVDHSRPQDRVPTFALFRLALNLGAALGPVIAILVAPHGLRLLFVIDASTYLLFSVWLGLGLPSERSTAAEDGAKASAVGSPTSRRANNAVQMLVIYISVFLITAVYYQYSSSVALAVTAHHSTSEYAMLLTLNGGVIIFFELPLTSITRRYNWRIPMAVGITLLAIGIAISGALRPYPLIVTGVVIWTVGEMFFSPVVSAAIASFSPPDRIGHYQGYLSMAQTIAFAVGPALGVFVYVLHPDLLWAGCLVAGATACVGILAVGRIPARETPAAQTSVNTAQRQAAQAHDS
jgi:MFS family permease